MAGKVRSPDEAMMLAEDDSRLKKAQTRFRGLAGKREGVARGVRMYLPRCSGGNGRQTWIDAGGGDEFEETTEAAVEEV